LAQRAHWILDFPHSTVAPVLTNHWLLAIPALSGRPIAAGGLGPRSIRAAPHGFYDR